MFASLLSFMSLLSKFLLHDNITLVTSDGIETMAGD